MIDVMKSIPTEVTIIILIATSCIAMISLILNIVMFSRHKKLSMSYQKFMQGSDGETLEASVLKRFQEIDDLKSTTKTMKIEIKRIYENLLRTYQHMGIVKYDAFKEMGGKLSFSLCMLNDNHDGFIVTSMHSNREGCYTYVKEIRNGESPVLLSEEEAEALKSAIQER